MSRLCVLALIVSCIGNLLIIRLPVIIASSINGTDSGVQRSFLGYASAFLAVLSASAGSVANRKLKDVNPTLTTFVSGFTAMIMSACLVPAFGGFLHIPCSPTSATLVAMSLMGFSSTLLWTAAMTKDEVSVVLTEIRTSELITAFIFQVAIFGEQIDGYSACGALLVLCAGLAMPLQIWMENLPDNSRWKFKSLLK